MRKYLWLILIILAPLALYAASGVNGVNEPAVVAGVATPDKVNSVSGLAAAGGLPSPDFEGCWGIDGTGCPGASVGATDELCSTAFCPGQFGTINGATRSSVTNGIFLTDSTSEYDSSAITSAFGDTVSTSQFDVRASAVNGYGAENAYIDIVSIMSVGGSNSMRLQANVDASNNLTKMRTVYTDDSDDQWPARVSVTFSANTWYTVTIFFQQATTTESNDGICQIWWDSTQVGNATAVDNNSKVSDKLNVGFVGAASATVNVGVWEFDNVKYWGSDQRSNLGF